MSKLKLIPLIAIIFLASCQEEKTNNDGDSSSSDANNEELIKLRQENRSLQSQVKEKDSSLNESIRIFNEIQENIASIDLKENEIRIKSDDPEFQADQKEWILNEIKEINFLREQNQKKVSQLKKQLAASNAKVSEFETLVDRLMRQISAQETEIANLKQELSDLDKEYTELFDAYREQTELALETMKELNEAYYAMGSYKELKENEVVVKEGGFIGLGRTEKLKDGFNKNYFTKIDIFKKTSFKIMAEKVNLITEHPSSSYEIKEDGNNLVLNVKEPKEFWTISKYLVIEIVK